MNVVEVDGLGKHFRTRQRAAGLAGSARALFQPSYRVREAVRSVSFSLERGEMLAFIGPNGAGKSTMIKMLTGILYPTMGQARVLGLVPWRERRALSYRIASVFGQKSQLWFHLPPRDTFRLLARIYDLDEAVFQKRLAFLVEAFEIEDYLTTPVRKLSLGERMRCELAAALLHGPEVLFLDEPTIGLDVIAKQRMRDLIGRLNAEEQTTVFLTSHDAGDVEQICRRAIVINDGQIILDAPVATLKREYLRSKTIDLLLEEVIEPEVTANAATNGAAGQPAGLVGLEGMEGVRVVKIKGHGVKLEVDTRQQPIEPVVSALMRRYRVLDLNIADPPMEEIIAAIYGTNGTSGAVLGMASAGAEPGAHSP
ncbi:MAG TPA: ATP-binding cassette domain-containing protein [Ktedonobacterales bacterium]|nr:ATP-binding cassette domain-containing protein [Ktedonobacterales bacterium]